jgi:hypothetical protein
MPNSTIPAEEKEAEISYIYSILDSLLGCLLKLIKMAHKSLLQLL